MNWGRAGVVAVGVLLIIASAVVLARATAAGPWVTLVVVAVGVALAGFPFFSSVARRVRSVDDGDA